MPRRLCGDGARAQLSPGCPRSRWTPLWPIPPTFCKSSNCGQDGHIMTRTEAPTFPAGWRLSNEEELVLLATRGRRTQSESDRLLRLLPDCDPEVLWREAAKHETSPQ